MQKESRQTKGAKAENFAKKHLEQKGYTFLEKNFFAKGGEIDLIMMDKDEIVFVEVKSIDKSNGFSIFETVTRTKFKRIKIAINAWLLRENRVGEIWRVDFVGLIMHNGVIEDVEHTKFLNID